MANLTSGQANILANDFLALAQSIGDYRYENWNDLTDVQNRQLGSFQRSILNAGEDILAFSTVLVMKDVDDSLNRMDTITSEIKSNIKFLKNIQRVINIASAIATLGSAILGKDPQAISTGLDGVISTWNSNQDSK